MILKLIKMVVGYIDGDGGHNSQVDQDGGARIFFATWCVIE